MLARRELSDGSGAPAAAGDRRLRLLEGAYGCIRQRGIGATSLEDVAEAAGVSRATLYRCFPGGRDELMAAVIDWQTLTFFERLAEAVAGSEDLESLLVDGILAAHRAIEDHDVLQMLLGSEPELLTPQLTFEAPLLLVLVRSFLLDRLDRAEMRPELEAEEAADYLARMVLSFISSPGGWDFDDRDQVALLVRSQMLAGVKPSPADRGDAVARGQRL